MTSTPDLRGLELVEIGMADGLDQRKSPRIEYCAAIPMNASLAGGLPSAEKFEPVETRDISENGLSFYTSTAPEERPIILHMGTPEEPVYMLARVTRCERDYDDPGRRFVVGCEFVGRVQLARSRS